MACTQPEPAGLSACNPAPRPAPFLSACSERAIGPAPLHPPPFLCATDEWGRPVRRPYSLFPFLPTPHAAVPALLPPFPLAARTPPPLRDNRAKLPHPRRPPASPALPALSPSCLRAMPPPRTALMCATRPGGRRKSPVVRPRPSPRNPRTPLYNPPIGCCKP